MTEPHNAGGRKRSEEGLEGIKMPQEVLAKIEKVVIMIVVIDDTDKALPLGKTLLKAGLNLIEITMRSEKAMEAIRILANQLPELLITIAREVDVTIRLSLGRSLASQSGRNRNEKIGN